MLNWHPFNKLPQTCGVRKYVCPVWIPPKDSFQSHPRTSIGINEQQCDQYNKTSQQSSTLRSKIKHPKTIF